jgi:hypothetical protein
MHEPSPLQSLPTMRRDRWTLLGSLLDRWCTRSTEPLGFTLDDVRNAERLLGFPIPTALAEWYCSSGKRRSVWSRQDDFLTPERLHVHNDALIFYVENQGVVQWGIPTEQLASDDPFVAVESVDDSDQWIPQTDNVSKFPIYMFAYTLAFADGDSWTYGYAKPPLVQTIVSRLPLLDFPTTWWTQTRLFGYDDLVVAIDGTDHVHACATSNAALAAFNALTTQDSFDMYASSDG